MTENQEPKNRHINNQNNYNEQFRDYYDNRVNYNQKEQRFKKQHAHFFQWVLTGLGIFLILYGLKILFTDGFIYPEAQIPLYLGCFLLVLICSYYAFFWKRYENYNNETNISKVRNWRRFAAVGMVGIPLSTFAAVHLWMHAPTNTIVTFAKYSVEQADPNQKSVQNLSESVRNNLEKATNVPEKKDNATNVPGKKDNATNVPEKKDTEIKQIPQSFTEDEKAIAEGKNRRATISIWGHYVSKPDIKDQVKVITLIELLKIPPAIFLEDAAKPKQNNSLQGASEDVFRVSELSIKNPDPISQNLSYYINFVTGLTYYKSGLAHCDPKKNVMSKESFEQSLKYLERASDTLPNDINKYSKELNKVFNKSTLDFFIGNVYSYKAYCSKELNSYDLAINSFTEAIQSNPQYVSSSENRQNYYVVEYPSSIIPASYHPEEEYHLSFDYSDDNEKKICGKKRDKNVRVDNSSGGFKILLSRSYYNRGIAYAMKGNSKKALADFKEAIKHDSKTNEFCIGLGSAYANLSYNYNNLAYESKEESNFNYYSDRGKYYYDYAIKNYKNAEDSLAYYNYGNISLRLSYHPKYYEKPAYYDKADLDEAIKKYQQAIKLDSNFTEAKNNLKKAEEIRKNIFLKSISNFFHELIDAFIESLNGKSSPGNPIKRKRVRGPIKVPV